MLHAKTTFYWQFCVNEEWYNFHAFHSQILENKFRDVNCDSTLLPKLNPELVNSSIKDILNLLGYDSIAVDFISMKIKCKTPTKTYAIRQLTTASSALCDIENSTIFNWYFRDNNDSWDLFSDSCMSSEIIEKAYQKDKSSPATFINNSTSFQYTIDFTQMVQTNMTTKTKRKIRRRPQPLKEKVKSEEKIIDLPIGWVHMDDDEEFKLYDLPSSSNGYKELKDIISQSLPMGCIFRIYRNQNLLMWNQYVNKQKELKKKDGEGFLNIQKLFHAVQFESLPEICMTNIDWRIHDPSTDKPF
ncbi:UNVERIFIED_CONTAM: hypothetical protein GTU68_038057, partial [Idotea baltica]|nr:hypothetical protein [Idotea baltica]